MASGHTLHLDALFIRAAHKAAVYILELAMGTTMEIFEPYAMLHRRPRPLSQSDDLQHPVWWTILWSWYEGEYRYWLCQAALFNMFSSFPQ